MHALVVYESMFGNTREVARAISEGIASRMPAELVEVAAAPSAIPADVGLLVVGGPTHARSLSNPKTRADAAGRAADKLVSRGIGLDQWLDKLQPAATPITAAAFDTSIKGPGLLWGSAAKAVTKRLRAGHFEVVAEPESFHVGGPTGPLFDRLVDGERERAVEWGARLAAGVVAPSTAR